MKNFSVQYLLSHIDDKKDVTEVPPSTIAVASSALNASTSDDVGKKITEYIRQCIVSPLSDLEDENRSSGSSSFYDSSNDEEDEQQPLNQNAPDCGTTSEDSQTSKYLQQEHKNHHHETSKRRKRRVLFSKQQTFELERRFRQQRYLSGRTNCSLLIVFDDFHFVL